MFGNTRVSSVDGQAFPISISQSPGDASIRSPAQRRDLNSISVYYGKSLVHGSNELRQKSICIHWVPFHETSRNQRLLRLQRRIKEGGSRGEFCRTPRPSYEGPRDDAWKPSPSAQTRRRSPMRCSPSCIDGAALARRPNIMTFATGEQPPLGAGFARARLVRALGLTAR